MSIEDSNGSTSCFDKHGQERQQTLDTILQFRIVLPRINNHPICAMKSLPRRTEEIPTTINSTYDRPAVLPPLRFSALSPDPSRPISEYISPAPILLHLPADPAHVHPRFTRINGSGSRNVTGTSGGSVAPAMLWPDSLSGAGADDVWHFAALASHAQKCPHRRSSIKRRGLINPQSPGDSSPGVLPCRSRAFTRLLAHFF